MTSSSPDNAAITANVRAEIARQRRTAASVARAIGIEPRRFRHLTRGEVDWTAAQLVAVAAELGVALDTLVHG